MWVSGTHIEAPKPDFAGDRAVFMYVGDRHRSSITVPWLSDWGHKKRLGNSLY